MQKHRLIEELLMLTSKNYTGESGFYARAVPELNDKYRKLCKVLNHSGVNELYEYPHVTLVYSKKKLKKALPKDIELNTTAKCLHLTYWEGHDKAGYVVLELECPAFKKLNAVFRNLGAEHSFDEYIPHMTVMKDCGRLTPKLKSYIERLNRVLSSRWYTLNFKEIIAEDLKK